MNRLYALTLLCLAATASHAQITITASDLPNAGDTLRYSTAFAPGTPINTGITGPNQNWNFSTLQAFTQSIDTYKYASQVHPAYAAIISPTAFGYKAADSIPGSSFFPITVKDFYTFFNKKPFVNPDRYLAEGAGIIVNGTPTAATYQDEDEWFMFPLQYGDVDSTTYFLQLSVAGLGTLKQRGYRKNTVDGWGTIVTPFTGPTPVQVIRVKSEVVGVDSLSSIAGVFTVPRHTVDYKWMANGIRYPLLWVITNRANGPEVITDIRYRDSMRTAFTSSVPERSQASLTVYPNPAKDKLHITLPAGWHQFLVRVYSSNGTLVASGQNKNVLDIAALAQGHYFVILESGGTTAIARFQK